MMPCTTLRQKQGANRNTATNQKHIGAVNSASYKPGNGSGGDFGMTIIDDVQRQCAKQTNKTLPRTRSNVEVGSV